MTNEAIDFPGPTAEQVDAQHTNGQGMVRSVVSKAQAKPEEGCRDYQVQTDCYVYRLIIWTLAGVVAVALLGSLALTFTARDIPDMLLAFGSGALGALAGLLAPPPSRQGGNSPVVGNNPG